MITRRWTGTGFAGSAVLLLLGTVRPTPSVAQEGGSPAQREAMAVARAQQLGRAGRGVEAVEVLEALLREQPASVSGLTLLLQMVERRGEPARALPWAERAVAAMPSGGQLVRQVWIRALAAAGEVDSAAAVARRWVESEPAEQAAWSELSAVTGRTSGIAGAIRVLEKGREVIGTRRLFVQELAVLYAEAARYEAAAVEWLVMLTWGDAGVEGVRRRIVELGSGQPRAVSALRAELGARSASVMELRGGVRLALELGDHEWSLELMRRLARDLPEPGRSRALVDYVREAREAGDLDGAAWAASELAGRAAAESEAEHWTTVAAELAFEAGDEATARSAFDRLLEGTEPGSDEHRLAILRLHDMAARQDAARADELLVAYRTEYADDVDTGAAMALHTAAAWIAEGELARARQLLETVESSDAIRGARRAALLGRLDVLEGRLTTARAHLELAATVPGSGTGTRVSALRWLALLEAADSVAVLRLGRAIVSASRGDAEPLVAAAEDWMTRDARGGSRLASLAARELDAGGFPREGDRIRAELVRRWPGSPEGPEALLALARRAVPSDPGQAAAWLQKLIIEYPNSALAPTARRELAALERTAGGA